MHHCKTDCQSHQGKITGATKSLTPQDIFAQSTVWQVNITLSSSVLTVSVVHSIYLVFNFESVFIKLCFCSVYFIFVLVFLCFMQFGTDCCDAVVS